MRFVWDSWPWIGLVYIGSETEWVARNGIMDRTTSLFFIWNFDFL